MVNPKNSYYATKCMMCGAEIAEDQSYCFDAALDLIRAQPDRFDLVVTDMTMPGITGDNLAREIKAIRPRLPVILCSGFSTRMDGQRAAAIGISAYVNKPVLRGQLARIIREVLDKHKGRQLCEHV